MTDVFESAGNDLILQMELFVNERLFQGGYITAEMYEKAKGMLLKGRDHCCV